MFPVTITVHNNVQLNAILAAMGDAGKATQVTAAEVRARRDADQTSMEDAKEAVQKEKIEKAEADPKPDAAPSSEPAQTQSDNSKDSSKESTQVSESDTEQPSYQEVAALITQVSRTAGRDAAVELLDSFGAKRGPDLKPEQYADVVAACEKALA